MDNEVHAEARSDTALERLRVVSQALTDAARRSRISKRSRRGYASGGFQARRGAVALRWAFVISFYVLVAVPSLAAVAYYGWFASDQYVATADFTVSGGEPIPIDGLASLTGIPALAIVQDTQVVVSYLHSRAAVDKLQGLVDLKGIYSSTDVDRLSRFDPDQSIERFVRYWDKMMDTAIKMPSGAVELRVRAFRPADAVRITQAALTVCEQLINEINDRMHHDAFASAEAELKRSSDRLLQTQTALEEARNGQGMLDATKAADAINKLITDTRSALLQLQEQYNAQRRFVSDSAPQTQAIRARIETTQAQIGDLEAKLTSTRASSGSATLAGAMSRFSELELEHTVAQRLYTGAAASVEAARLVAEQKMMYLNTFVEPALPEQAEYPRRLLRVALVVGGSLLVWGACCGLATTIRNNMA